MRTDYLRNGIILFIIFLIFAWITIDWGLEFGFADLVLLIVSSYYIIAGLVKSSPTVTRKFETSFSTTKPIQTQIPAPTYPQSPQTPQPPTPQCPTCSQPLTWIQQYQRWYCYNERKYLFSNAKYSPVTPTPISQTAPQSVRSSTQPLEHNTASRLKAQVLTVKQTQDDKLSEENARLIESLKKKADEGEISEESYSKLKKELRSKKQVEMERKDLQQQLDMLDKRLIEGKISETTYRELKEKIQSKLNKLE